MATPEQINVIRKKFAIAQLHESAGTTPVKESPKGFWANLKDPRESMEKSDTAAFWHSFMQAPFWQEQWGLLPPDPERNGFTIPRRNFKLNDLHRKMSVLEDENLTSNVDYIEMQRLFKEGSDEVLKQRKQEEDFYSKGVWHATKEIYNVVEKSPAESAALFTNVLLGDPLLLVAPLGALGAAATAARVLVNAPKVARLAAKAAAGGVGAATTGVALTLPLSISRQKADLGAVSKVVTQADMKMVGAASGLIGLFVGPFQGAMGRATSKLVGMSDDKSRLPSPEKLQKEWEIQVEEGFEGLDAYQRAARALGIDLDDAKIRQQYQALMNTIVTELEDAPIQMAFNDLDPDIDMRMGIPEAHKNIVSDLTGVSVDDLSTAVRVDGLPVDIVNRIRAGHHLGARMLERASRVMRNKKDLEAGRRWKKFLAEELPSRTKEDPYNKFITDTSGARTTLQNFKLAGSWKAHAALRGKLPQHTMEGGVLKVSRKVTPEERKNANIVDRVKNQPNAQWVRGIDAAAARQFRATPLNKYPEPISPPTKTSLGKVGKRESPYISKEFLKKNFMQAVAKNMSRSSLRKGEEGFVTPQALAILASSMGMGLWAGSSGEIEDAIGGAILGGLAGAFLPRVLATVGRKAASFVSKSPESIPKKVKPAEETVMRTARQYELDLGESTNPLPERPLDTSKLAPENSNVKVDPDTEWRVRLKSLFYTFMSDVATSGRFGLQLKNTVIESLPSRTERIQVTEAILQNSTNNLTPVQVKVMETIKNYVKFIKQNAVANKVESAFQDGIIPSMFAHANSKAVMDILAYNKVKDPFEAIKVMKEHDIDARTLDAAEILGIYNNAVGRARATEFFISDLKLFKGPNGLSVILHGNARTALLKRSEARGYGTSGTPYTDPETGAINMQSTMYDPLSAYESIDHPLFRGFYAHPDLAPDLQLFFDSKQTHAWLKAAQGVNFAVKRMAVGMSLFHAKALIESLIYAGVGKRVGAAAMVGGVAGGVASASLSGEDPGVASIALGAGIASGAMLKRQISPFLRLLNEGGTGDLVDFSLRSGLRISVVDDIGNDEFYRLLDVIGKKADEIIPGPSKIIKGVAAANRMIDNIMWDKVLTGTKLIAFENTYNKLNKMNINLAMKNPDNTPIIPDEHLGRIAAEFVNDAFGNIAWERLALDAKDGLTKDLARMMARPSNKPWAQLLLFAPDWTTSNIRIIGKAIDPGITKVDARKLHMAYAVRASLWYAMVGSALQYMFTGESLWDKVTPDMSLQEKYKALSRIDLGDGRSMGFSKQYTEFFHWLVHPVKSGVGKKGSLITLLSEIIMNKEYLTVTPDMTFAGPSIVEDPNGLYSHLYNPVDVTKTLAHVAGRMTMPISLQQAIKAYGNDQDVASIVESVVSGSLGFPLYGRKQ